MTKVLRTLVVEDEIHLRECIVFELESEGIQTIEAGSGEEGLKKFHEEKPDAILSDVRMPDGDGVWLLNQIRETDQTVPFLFMSAYTEIPESEALEQGADFIFSKPFRSEDIISCIQELSDPESLWNGQAAPPPVSDTEVTVFLNSAPFGTDSEEFQAGRRGFFISTLEQQPIPGKVIHFILEYSSGEIKELSCFARCLWSRKTATDRYHSGCAFRFLSMDKASTQFIRNWSVQNKIKSSVPSGIKTEAKKVS